MSVRKIVISGNIYFLDHESDGVNQGIAGYLIIGHGLDTLIPVEFTPLRIELLATGFANCVVVPDCAEVFYARPLGRRDNRYFKYVKGVGGTLTNVATIILKADVLFGVRGWRILAAHWGEPTPMMSDDPNLRSKSSEVARAAKEFWAAHALVDTGAGYDRTTITPTPPPGWE
jgi:hypothetical protein